MGISLHSQISPFPWYTNMHAALPLKVKAIAFNLEVTERPFRYPIKTSYVNILQKSKPEDFFRIVWPFWNLIVVSVSLLPRRGSNFKTIQRFQRPRYRANKKTQSYQYTWWRHQMEIFSALLTICRPGVNYDFAIPIPIPIPWLAIPIPIPIPELELELKSIPIPILELTPALAICAENSLVPGEFPSQRPVTRSFDVSLICE